MSAVEREVQVMQKKTITVCDGPDCLEVSEDGYVPVGWFIVDRQVTDRGSVHDDVWHFHTLACMAGWIARERGRGR